ncbi:MAG: flavodoxin domain-containing protein [bacterium]
MTNNSSFKALKITDRVYWVGAIDWDVRDFHGYTTNHGTTYNAFLITGEKNILIDTVKKQFCSEMVGRISSVIPIESIDVIISNHAEMDHSGCLPEIIKAVNPETVYASAFGVKTLNDHFHLDTPITAVKDGETMTIGDATITFAETRMLHWPDSMMSYLHGDEVLFSNDAFGMHLASSERFADEIEPSILAYEAKSYYANILLPFSHLIKKAIDKVNGLNVSIKYICCDHGPMWRNADVATPIKNYINWSEQKRNKNVVVLYDTMWNSTAMMAEAIVDGLISGGVSAKVMPLRSFHRSDVATEILDAGALLVGSPTLNNGLYPTLADTLTYLKGLKPKGLKGAVFGSFGWSGEATTILTGILTEMGVDLIAEPLKVKYVPDAAALTLCREFGIKVAEAVSGNE